MAKRQTTDPWAIEGRLTDSIAAALTPPASGNRIRWDGPGGMAGFGCRVTSAGAKAWALRYRNSGGKDRTATIGTADPQVWTCAKARARAGELRQSIDLGADPLSDRKAQREAEDVAGLLKLYLAAHGPTLTEFTRRDYASMIRDHVNPAIGSIKLTVLRRTDCQQLHDKVVATGATIRANRCLAVLSGALSFAVERELITINPASGTKLTREEPRQRFLSPQEIERLLVALDATTEQQSADAIRLLLFTGARKSEVLGLRWDELDMAQGIWTKPAARVKQRRTSRIPLNAIALDVLRRRRAAADIEDARRETSGLPPVVHVFPGRPGQPQANVRFLWNTVCRDAKIAGNVRLHDLRHSYASVLASAGLSLLVIGQLLGHSQQSTTQRYAHLLDETLRAATERAGKIIDGK